MKRLHEFPEIVDDEILELKPEDGFPSGKRLQRIEQVRVGQYLRFVRQDVLQVEPRIVVGKAVLHRPRLFARLRVVPFVLRDETRIHENLQCLGKRPAAFDAECLGDFAARPRAVDERTQDILLHQRLLAKNLAEDRLEVLEQDAVPPETHPLDVLVGAQSGIDFLEIPRYSTGHRQHVENLRRRKPRGGISPKGPAPRKRELADNDVAREACGEPGVLKDVPFDPSRDRTTDHNDKMIVLFQHRVPCALEPCREICVVPPHPRNLVKQQYRPVVPCDRLVESNECLVPRRDLRPVDACLRGQFLDEVVELNLIRHAFARKQTVDAHEPTTVAPGEFLNQR